MPLAPIAGWLPLAPNSVDAISLSSLPTPDQYALAPPHHGQARALPNHILPTNAEPMRGNLAIGGLRSQSHIGRDRWQIPPIAGYLPLAFAAMLSGSNDHSAAIDNRM